MRRLLLTLLLSACWASPAVAATPYYEFSPDYAKSLLVASSGAVSQIFLPLNDYLGSFDLWVSNANTAGDATFTLYNQAGTAPTSRTISVPAIADSETGTRLHVALPSQIPVVGGNAYSIGITSSAPTLRLYYGDATKILAHNGEPLPVYTGGLANIDGEDMGFSFKFALFESAESSAPVITNVAISQPNTSQAVLSFNANEPVDRKVSYGSSTADWTGAYSSCIDGVQSCSVTLSVIPGTAYSFTLTARDVWGNDSQVSGTFTATGQGVSPTLTPTAIPTATATPTPTATATAVPTSTPDISTPVISNLRAVNATASSIGLAWTTSKATDSNVVVQLLPYFINAAVGSDATLELEHYIEITGLDSDTAYVARITSTDSIGNGAAASLNIRTTTVVRTTPTPPTSSDGPTPTPTVIIAGNPDSPVVSWQQPTQQPAGGYRVDIFDANNNLIKTVRVPAGQLDVTLDGLPDGQSRIVVYADHDGVFQKVASETRVPIKHAASTLERITSGLPYALLAVVLVIGITIFILKQRAKKAVTTPPASPPVTQVTTQP